MTETSSRTYSRWMRQTFRPTCGVTRSPHPRISIVRRMLDRYSMSGFRPCVMSGGLAEWPSPCERRSGPRGLLIPIQITVVGVSLGISTALKPMMDICGRGDGCGVCVVLAAAVGGWGEGRGGVLGDISRVREMIHESRESPVPHRILSTLSYCGRPQSTRHTPSRRRLSILSLHRAIVRPRLNGVQCCGFFLLMPSCR
jgi:hypothetical protein